MEGTNCLPRCTHFGDINVCLIVAYLEHNALNSKKLCREVNRFARYRISSKDDLNNVEEIRELYA